MSKQNIKGDTKEPVHKKVLRNVQDLAGFITAMAVIFGGLIAAGRWIVVEINASVNARVSALEQKIDNNQTTNEQAITRLELMELMEDDPDNVIEIEKLAKKYFNPPMNGNSYMTGQISQWCGEHGVDCGTIILK